MGPLIKVLSGHLGKIGAIIALVFVFVLSSLIIPIGNSLWTEGVTIKGNVTTGEWPLDNGETSIFTRKTAWAHWKKEDGRFVFPLIVVVRGEICVTNSGSNPTRDLTINDQVMYFSNGRFWPLPDASFSFSPTEQILPGQKVCYPYEMEFHPKVGVLFYHNTVRAVISNLSSHSILKNLEGQGLSMQSGEIITDDTSGEGADAAAEFTMDEPPTPAEPTPTQEVLTEPGDTPAPQESMTPTDPILPPTDQTLDPTPSEATPTLTDNPWPTETPPDLTDQPTDPPQPTEPPLPTATPVPSPTG